MPITKADIKYIKQLQQKKYRKQYGVFVVEGWKSIQDFIKAGYLPQKIYATKQPDDFVTDSVESVTGKQLKQISSLQHPKDALAVFKIQAFDTLPSSGLILALDDLQDPGNLGTIIRTADWFGVRQIVCSENTVDCYNPKVVQATMGALANVSIIYTDLEAYLKQINLPVYGTFLDGENIYKSTLPQEAVMVIGNEGNGIKPEIAGLTTHKLHIPKAPDAIAESLNAAIATAVVLNEFKRINMH